MAGLQIKNETVYVIYRNGQPYQEKGRKIVYTSKGAANGVITADVNEEASRVYDRKRKESGYKMQEWYWLTKEEQDFFANEIRKQFEIVEYGPKEARQ